jgi:hypothetical protein
VEAEAVEPAFVVLERGEDVGPGEGFAVISVGAFEACVDECSLRLVEEWRSGRVVVDEEICYEGDDYSQ